MLVLIAVSWWSTPSHSPTQVSSYDCFEITISSEIKAVHEAASPDTHLVSVTSFYNIILNDASLKHDIPGTGAKIRKCCYYLVFML